MGTHWGTVGGIKGKDLGVIQMKVCRDEGAHEEAMEKGSSRNRT
jgi:hypothetical protein